MPCTILVGGQWGDEAKGKFCSYLALTDDSAIACRAGDGPGAGPLRNGEQESPNDDGDFGVRVIAH